MKSVKLTRYKLGDLATIISGVSYSPNDILSEKDSHSIRILRGGNIQGNHVILKEDDVFLPIEYSLNNTEVTEGDNVITASTGSLEALGKSARIDKDFPNCYVGAFMRIIRPKSLKWREIISMYLQSDYFSKYIRSQAKGTSINNITKGYLENFPVYLTEEENLRRISRFYKTLSDKIALNREINRNLCASRDQNKNVVLVMPRRCHKWRRHLNLTLLA